MRLPNPERPQIALGDVSHPHAEAALRFFEEQALRDGWATCPLVENAFIRILGWPGYPGGPGSTGEARRMLLSLLNAPGHQFSEQIPARFLSGLA